MSTEAKCPRCGAAILPDSPGGLCPACLLRKGMNPTQEAPSAAADWTPPAPQKIAEMFPEFDSVELIGRGGMGAVYKVRQTALDRVVAFKILPPHLAADPGFAMRFSREAQAMARLSHPHIVTIYEFGERGEVFYFIMEYVDGANLRHLIDAGGLSPREALAIVPQICEALQFAHDNGIVHRDIKPENILLDRQGKVKIADFGLARIARPSPDAPQLAATVQVMGTPYYMAPEQLSNPQAVDHRADIYSLGVVFYQLLTGDLPIGRFDPPSRKVQVDVRLDEVVLKALEREPERRFQHASDVKERVETIATGVPVHGSAGTVLGIILVGRRHAKPWVCPKGVFAALFTAITAYLAAAVATSVFVPLPGDTFAVPLLVTFVMGMVIRAVTLKPSRLLDLDALPSDTPRQSLLTGWRTLFAIAQLRDDHRRVNWLRVVQVAAYVAGSLVLCVGVVRLVFRFIQVLPAPVSGLMMAMGIASGLLGGFLVASWLWRVPARIEEPDQPADAGSATPKGA